MKRVLIDTDVILDFFFDRKPFADNAGAVLSLCESGEITGYVTSVIISNLYYILRRVARHEKVVERLQQLILIVDFLVTDKDVIKQALNSRFKDFEDSLQNFSAEKNGAIEVVITRNVKDFKNSSLGVMTPENFLKLYAAIRKE